MAEQTLISWCDSTFSAWIGCTKVSTAESGGGACDKCYAAALNHRFNGGGNWGPGAPRRRTSDANWKLPRSWQRKHAEFYAEHGHRRSVFLNNQADIFDNEVDDALRAEVFDLVEATPDLDWLLLTKRIGNARRMLPAKWLEPGAWPKHVRLGITVCNQGELDRDAHKLLSLGVPNFFSIEPQLGRIDLCELLGIWWNSTKGCYDRSAAYPNLVNWVIVGGESGPGARPLQVEWVHSIVSVCKAAGVPVHVKQLGHVVLTHGMTSPGEHWPAGTKRIEIPRRAHTEPAFEIRLHHPKGGDPAEWPEDLRIQEFPASERNCP
jgi:protein gp37